MYGARRHAPQALDPAGHLSPIRADLPLIGSSLPQPALNRMGRWWRRAIPSADRHRALRMVRDMGRRRGYRRRAVIELTR
jgi:hypothetical protein